MSRPSIVLLQVRDHDGARRHEHDCVAQRLDRPLDSITTINAVAHPEVSYDDVKGADLVIVGGAGSHSAIDDDPFTGSLMEIMRRVVDDRRPFFGSCYGHQLLARALGGDVVHDPEHEEIGTFDVTLNEAGIADPLFEGAETTFPVQLGHHDRVDALPPEAIILGASERCAVQVLRIGDRPVYGTQFHGEMNTQDMRDRLDVYGDEYFSSEEDRQRFLTDLRETPFVAELLRRFVELYA